MATIAQENSDEPVRLIEIIKYKTDFDSINQYNSYRDTLISTSIHPWINTEALQKDTCECIPDVLWGLTVNNQSNCTTQPNLISFAEIELEGNKQSSRSVHEMYNFDEWVTHFEPKSWGDWLMVPKLFLNYLKTGYNLPALSVTSDPWIDSVLCDSRGRLTWSYQFIELIRMIAGVGITEATNIYKISSLYPDLLRKNLEQINYPPTNQTLMQIFNERTIGMMHLGSPDYFLANYLSKHYNKPGSNRTPPHEVNSCKQILIASPKDFIALNELLPRVANTIELAQTKDSENTVTGVATGFTDLDSITSGLHSGDLIILAGRPSMGKTTFALNIAKNIALESKLPVAIFSMNASLNQIALQITTLVSKLDKHKILAGEIEDDEWESLLYALGKLVDAPIFIDDQCGLNCNDISARLDMLKKQHASLGLIIIDHLQLMTSCNGHFFVNNSELADGTISSLKVLAKQINCPIIVLSNLSRKIERRIDKRPLLNDLPISNFADVVLFIYRDEVYNPDTMDKNTVEINIARHRNGQLGRVRLNYNGLQGVFEDCK